MKDHLPHPDRVMATSPVCSVSQLALNCGDAKLTKESNGSYRVQAKREDGTTLDLTFSPEKPATRHGKDGIVAGKEGDDMFYYFHL